MAHYRARRALKKASMKPTPRDLTSKLHYAVTWCPTMSLCRPAFQLARAPWKRRTLLGRP